MNARLGAAAKHAGAALAAALLTAMPAPDAAHAFGRTLDEMFRDTLRRENDGSLPGFVLNRGQPPYPETKPPTPDELAARARAVGPSVVEEDLTAAPTEWQDVVESIGSGSPGPFAVEVVRQRAQAADPQAVELLAWMHANGVGVRRDLHAAFTLYRQAEALGIPGAGDNAKAVYRALPPNERSRAGNPF